MKKNIVAIILFSILAIFLTLPLYILIEFTFYVAFDPRSTHVFIPLYVFIIIDILLLGLFILSVFFIVKNIIKLRIINAKKNEKAK